MKKLILAFLLLFIVALSTNAQYTTGWDKAMNFGGGGVNVDEMRYVNGDLYFVASMMGKYQFAGVNYDAGGASYGPATDVLFGKITSTGTQVLLYKFNGSESAAIKRTIGPDGSLYIFRLGFNVSQTIGNITTPTNGLQLIKFNSSGQVEWLKKLNQFTDVEFGYGNTPNGGAIVHAFQVLDNGEMFVAVQSSIPRGAVTPNRVIKLDVNGDEVWNYEFTGSGSMYGMPKKFVDNNGNVTFKVSGLAYQSYDNDNWLVGLNSAGVKKWEISTQAYIHFYGVNPVNGDAIIIYQYVRSPATLPMSPFNILPNTSPNPATQFIWKGVITINPLGTISKTRSGVDFPLSMEFGNDGRHLVYGFMGAGLTLRTEDNFVTTDNSGVVGFEVDNDFKPISVFRMPTGSAAALNGNKFAAGGTFKTALTVGSSTITPYHIDTDFNTRFPSWVSIKADVLIAEGNLDNMPLSAENTTWIGTTSDWNTPSNWTNGVPNADKRATFSGTPNLMPATFPPVPAAGQLVVTAGSEIKLPAAFKVSDRIFNEGKITVENPSFFTGFGASEIKGNGELFMKGAGYLYYTAKMENTLSFDNAVTVAGPVNSLKFIGANATISGDVTVTNPAENAITGAASATNFVNGTLTRAINTSGTYTFPVGTGSGANRKTSLVTFTPTSLAGTTSVAIKYTAGAPTNGAGGGAPNVIVNNVPVTSLLNGGFLTITPNAQPSSGTYGLDFSIMGSSNTVVDPLKYVLIKRDNSTSPWVFQGNYSNAPTITGSGTAAVVKVSLNGITSFSDFAIGMGNNAITLPVTLTKFTAKAETKTTALYWETASELNNDKFEIEKSTDGKDFLKIGEVKGNGTSQKINAYSYRDFTPANGLNYYRLKQLDFNGAYAYSDIKFVNFDLKETTFTVFPNPVTEVVNFSETVNTVEIYNLQGKLVLRQNNPASSVKIPSHLPNGLYLIKVKLANGNPLTKQIIITK